ncbi:MAG: hypothetical protein HZB31_06120 [Nitrospirae bacterium]|nr:hypothetical protein [Nitrospirota bacterium]
MKNILLRRLPKNDFIGIRVSKQLKERIRREAWKRRVSLSDLVESLFQDRKVKVSTESALSLRISSVESKLDQVLSFLQAPQGSLVINPDVMQDAIRAHIMGDRGPIDALEKICQLQENASRTPISNTVGTSTGVDKKTV